MTVGGKASIQVQKGPSTPVVSISVQSPAEEEEKKLGEHQSQFYYCFLSLERSLIAEISRAWEEEFLAEFKRNDYFLSLGGVFGQNQKSEMASRPIVPQQPRGGAVVGGGKQKTGAAEGRNRRALGDIGNLVTVRGAEGKPQPQFSRPVTRSFCAQLLANAQAAAAENNKKPVATVVVDGVVVGKAGPRAKATLRNAIVKPKPETVIQKNLDTEDEIKKEKPVSHRKLREGSSRKNIQTLTSTLTARSKAACGLTEKLKDLSLDIDAADADNQLAVVEYNESRVHGYIESQPDINEKMRAILVDWLIEVHNKFELMPETLYLTLNIVDRFLSMKTVPRRELQLVGISAMLIACKYEEIWAPEVNDFVCISDQAYAREQILVMEKAILGKLEWGLTVPTPYVFLTRFIKASVPDQEMENMVFFLAELGLMHYATIMFCPSMIAASAVYAARCTLNKSPLWNETLKLHTGFSEPQLMDCAKLLVEFHSMAAESKLKVVYRKYSNPQHGAVAQIPPAKNLLAIS
ncbi:hypothetical protein HHK36_017894 [Tetracentron sinense]|uniref:B-like cyclin n=1 Tax=Tetracentron sinense TaxID=13715 RepID=A0A834YUY6_TETSI|nr:hypothetical protein HHK36_017894 [Tetracentron sinense]